MDDDNAERADVPAAEEDNADEAVSWPVLSDLDLSVCITDSTAPNIAPRPSVAEPSDPASSARQAWERQ